MTEPLFFDCLTDAQFWSLFDAGVLHDYMMPVEVYERLKRIAPGHGCYLFSWPEGMALPSLEGIVPGFAGQIEEPPTQAHSDHPETHVTVERMRSAIEAFCERVDRDIPLAGRWIHGIATNPHPELRAGPYLGPQVHEEAQPHDLHAMSMRELEAYLDGVLRVDEGNDVDSAEPPARRLERAW